MGSHVLVLNAGSSSLKYRVVDVGTGEPVAGGSAERVDDGGFPGALEQMRAELSSTYDGQLTAVGHRVPHGGPRYTDPVLLDDDVVAGIEQVTPFAPLHNPPALAGIRSAREAWPDLPHVAVFDTGFFADLPEVAATYAVDADVAERQGLRRYGAHGTSHRYVAAEAARFLGKPVEALDQIVLHLGDGASVAAIRGGRPVEVSTGLTPLEGLVMGTRAGDVDPGLLLHLLRHGGPDGRGLSVDELEDLLLHRSGLEGLAGSSDFRDLARAVAAGDERARLAYRVYCHRIRKYVGAYLAVLDGADAIVFTGGVGEHHPRLRADALWGLDKLGIQVDPVHNGGPATGIRRLSGDESRVCVLLVPTNEELQIAREVVALLD